MLTGSFFAFIFHWGVEEVHPSAGMNKISYKRFTINGINGTIYSPIWPHGSTSRVYRLSRQSCFEGLSVWEQSVDEFGLTTVP